MNRVNVQIDSFEDGSGRITLTARFQDTKDGLPEEYEMKSSQTFIGSNSQNAIELVLNHPAGLINLCESPAEARFYIFSLGRVSNLRPQVEIGPYRVDLALPERKIAIEIDGHDNHKTREQRTNDAQRERYLQLSGWHVIRFTGSEIYKDVVNCVEEVAKLLDVFETKNSNWQITPIDPNSTS